MLRIQPIAPIHIPGFHLALDALSPKSSGKAAMAGLFQTTASVTAAMAAGYPRFVAVTANRVVGWCGLLPNVDGVWRIDIGVTAESRRQGIGSMLMTALVDAADALGCEAIGLELYEDAGQATRLLGALGFELQGSDLSKTRYWLRRCERQVVTAQSSAHTVANEFIH